VSPPGKETGPPRSEPASKVAALDDDTSKVTMSTDSTTTAAINPAGGRVMSSRHRLPPPDPRRPGFVPHVVALAFGTAADAAELVRAGLWQRVPGGYQIVDYERQAMRLRIALAVRGGRR
jgi:hypothetical protein